MIQIGRPSRSARGGAALLMAMIALTTILVLGAAFLRLGLHTKNEGISALDQDRAFYLAEAAIAESGAALLRGRTGAVASQALPARFGNGLFWVGATDLGNGDYQLDATAMCDGGRAAVRTVVHLAATHAATAALLGDQGVTLASNVLVDSYDPSHGAYAAQPKIAVPGGNANVVDTKGTVRSNQAIAVDSSDGLYGNVMPGPSSAVNGIKSNTFIYGSTAPATQTVPMPPVVVPTIASQGVKSISKTDSAALRTLVPGSYHFSSLTIGNQAAFTIRGPATVVLDSFTGSSGCSLLVDGTGGPVNVYFTGAASFVSNMDVVTNGTTAKSVSFLFSSNLPISLSSNASMIGTIYAPNAAVTISSNWTVFGAVTAKVIDVAANTQIHYDESLGSDVRAGFPTLTVASWTREALPTASLGRKRSDPFALLGVQRANCPNPANAWR